MSLARRDFLQLLAAASAAGMALDGGRVLAAEPAAAERLYEQPAFGNVSVLHFTDCHAQLLPLHFREPHVNIGVGPAAGKPPHLAHRFYHVPASNTAVGHLVLENNQ